MSQEVSSTNKRIAKNTLFLYVRMLLVMGVSIFTSRVILQTLGVEDYGIYNAVGGIVAVIGVLNGALSSSTSRFLAYELGMKDAEMLKRTFSVSLNLHMAVAFIVLLLAETIGLRGVFGSFTRKWLYRWNDYRLRGGSISFLLLR